MRPSALILPLRVFSLIGLMAIVALMAGSAPARAAAPAWTTYDHDAMRSATDPSSGSPVTPVPAWSAPAQLDGPIYTQPLVYGSLVFVATEKDTVYALDAATGAIVWQRTVGTPVPSTDLPCGNISPTVGITGTPVIDPANGHIFAVADELVGGAVQHELVALDVATGQPVAGFPIRVDPPGADPTALLQRAALALIDTRVVVPYGGNSGDCGVYHGWLVSAPEIGSGSQTTFEVEAGAGEHGGAIWGGGDGPVLGPGVHLFVSTGNGFGSTTPDLQESVVELTRYARPVAHWTAPNWQALDNSDLDLGSSEPLPLPGGLLFVIGKDGVGRLLSESALGTQGQVFSAQVCTSGGGYGASLYKSGMIYVPCSDGLTALTLSTAPSPSFSALSSWRVPSHATGPPIFAGGMVWSTSWPGHDLYGLGALTGAIRFQTTLGSFINHFATPSAGGGRLFVAWGSAVTALTITSARTASAR